MQGKAVSLPQLCLLTDEGDTLPVEGDLTDLVSGRGPISPLSPSLAPTFRSQALSPFWLSGSSAPPQLHQISGRP